MSIKDFSSRYTLLILFCKPIALFDEAVVWISNGRKSCYSDNSINGSRSCAVYVISYIFIYFSSLWWGNSTQISLAVLYVHFPFGFLRKFYFVQRKKKWCGGKKVCHFMQLQVKIVKVICHLFHFDLSFRSNGIVHFTPYSIGIWIENDRSPFNCCHPTNTNKINSTKS